ncbi:hypothetical protein DXB25_18890 [Lachnospiraceae bacterium OM02-31]|nr:hypothetical protein DXB25_18890 [Lachnospiraceae bacterium OM02-31]RJW54936.1 hypothetical protein DXB24_23810 [Lachnospiraceae bacterium OM02-3]
MFLHKWYDWCEMYKKSFSRKNYKILPKLFFYSCGSAPNGMSVKNRRVSRTAAAAGLNMYFFTQGK